MIPIFDNGHGGIIGGIYQTAGKRSPSWGEGTLFEGVFNREIITGLIKRCNEAKLPYFYVSEGQMDTPLTIRVKRANEAYKAARLKGHDGYLFSVHANAGGGTGWELFTSIGLTKSDKVGEIIIKHLGVLPLKERVDMSDGDKDKEADFYVLKQTNGAAVLLECAFMDNPQDYELLWSKDFHKQLIDVCFEAILELYKIKTI